MLLYMLLAFLLTRFLLALSAFFFVVVPYRFCKARAVSFVAFLIPLLAFLATFDFFPTAMIYYLEALALTLLDLFVSLFDFLLFPAFFAPAALFKSLTDFLLAFVGFFAMVM